MNNLLTIVIPYYKTTPMIRDCVYESLSILEDKDKLEVIMVCDGSDDEDLMKDRLKDLNINIIYLHNDINLGPGPSRNLGIRSSHGDYILCWDCDDLITDKNLILKILNENNDFIYLKLKNNFNSFSMSKVAFKRYLYDKYNILYINSKLDEDSIFLRHDVLFNSCDISQGSTFGDISYGRRDNDSFSLCHFCTGTIQFLTDPIFKSISFKLNLDLCLTYYDLHNKLDNVVIEYNNDMLYSIKKYALNSDFNNIMAYLYEYFKFNYNIEINYIPTHKFNKQQFLNSINNLDNDSIDLDLINKFKEMFEL